MNEKEIVLVSKRVIPKSCRHMSDGERLDHTREMIRDLEAMDGCIAAAWALEFIKTVTFVCIPRGR